MELGGNQPHSCNRSNYNGIPQNGFNSMVSPNKYPLNCIILADLVNQVASASKRKPPQLRRGFMTVPRVGLEPTLPEGNWILNPARLPISPPRLLAQYLIY